MSAYSDSGGESVQYSNEPQQSRLFRSKRARPSVYCVRTSQDVDGVECSGTEHDQSWRSSSSKQRLHELLDEPHKLESWLEKDAQADGRQEATQCMDQSLAEPQPILFNSPDPLRVPPLRVPPRKFKLRQKSASEANTMKPEQPSDAAGPGNPSLLMDARRQVGTSKSSLKMRYVSCASHSSDASLAAPWMEGRTRLVPAMRSNASLSERAHLPENRKSSARRLRQTSQSFSQESQGSTDRRHPIMPHQCSLPQPASLRTRSNRSTHDSETYGSDGSLNRSRKQDNVATQVETLKMSSSSRLNMEHTKTQECLDHFNTLQTCSDEAEGLISHLQQAERQTNHLLQSQLSVLSTPTHGCFGASSQQAEQVTMLASPTQEELCPNMTRAPYHTRTELPDHLMPHLSWNLQQESSRPRRNACLTQDLLSKTRPALSVPHAYPSLSSALLPQRPPAEFKNDSEQCITGSGLCATSKGPERHSTHFRTSMSRRAVSQAVTIPSSSLCLSSSPLQSLDQPSLSSSQASSSTLSLQGATDHAAPLLRSIAAEACKERLPIAHRRQPSRLGQEHPASMPKTFNATAIAHALNTPLSAKLVGPKYGEMSQLINLEDTCYSHCSMRSEQRWCRSWRGARRSRQSQGLDLTGLSAAIAPQFATDHSSGGNVEGLTTDHIIHQLCPKSHHLLPKAEMDSRRSTTASTAASTINFKASQNTSMPDRTLASTKPDLKLATACLSREKEDLDIERSIQRITSGGLGRDGRPPIPRNTCSSQSDHHSPQCPDHRSIDSSPVSPGNRSYTSAEDQNYDGDGYETPMTSPESSPIKHSRPAMRRLPGLSSAQLDGGNECMNSDTTPDEPVLDVVDEGADTAFLSEDETPLVPASPAKGAYGSHCRIKGLFASDLSTPQRRPSALLQHYERNATSRQRKLMFGGLQSPDRFIPNRMNNPTKDAFSVNKRSGKIPARETYGQLPAAPSDPFAPAPRRTLRMTERYATLRGLAPAVRSTGRTSTLVADARLSNPRAVSEGAIWTVGSTLVTKGVPSTTTGRGGRVTSGSLAPHYSADFLRRVSTHEEEDNHGRRLALAMGMDQNTRLLDHSSPLATPSAPFSSVSSQAATGGRVWRDGGWQRESPVSPTKGELKKLKDVPVIPFRVLDAPALRDDYYCSLLAYSPTVDCLAVGLGPHVYLWSEDRHKSTSKLPDSLTAPFSAHITSLSFSSTTGGSAVLAIGRADGRITLWSPLDRDPRFDSEQPSAVSFVCFRPSPVRRQSVRDNCATVLTEELLVGDEAGHVYLYSVEWPDQDQRDLFDWHGSMTLLARINCHSQQVCGIAWSRDGEFFATGGNDNQLFLFETKKVMKQHRRRQQVQGSEDTVKVRSGDQDPLDSVAGQGTVLNILPGQQKHIFTLNAAVRALAFAPWQPSLLAAGGGSNDRCIHFFHTVSGARLATIDCHAQVTSLIWSEKRKEIAATFGFAQPEHKIRVAVFSWPSCRCVVRIPWVAEERALHSVAYPRGPAGGLIGQRTTDVREGGPWYGKRTRQEGCLVVATSDASIKFHELWPERDGTESMSPIKGVLGGSHILEGNCSNEVEEWGAIR